MQKLLIALLLALPFELTVAQNPGQNIAVDVQITSVARTSDTTGISYVLSILPSSTEQFGRFSVDVPGGVLRITTPSPATQWASATDFGGRPLAHWVGGMISAGSSTPELHFDAVGLPGILTYWAGGVFHFPSREENDILPTVGPLQMEMINGQTVGVEPWPADRSPQALIARLRVLTQTACGAPLLWISSATLCTALTSDLDQAESSRSNGQPTDAKNSLNTFITAITGSSPGTFAPGVTSAGYWLLKPNADIIISLL